MIRGLVKAALISGLVATSLHAGPVQGPTARDYRMLPAGEAPNTVEFAMTFTGGQRACIIVRGDHKPPVPLEITVYGRDGQVVAEDKSDQDFLAVLWTPPRTGEYRIVVRNYGREHYATYAENQKFTDVWLSIK